MPCVHRPSVPLQVLHQPLMQMHQGRASPTVLLLGDELIACEVLGISAVRTTLGHRFPSTRTISLKSARSYEGAVPVTLRGRIYLPLRDAWRYGKKTSVFLRGFAVAPNKSATTSLKCDSDNPDPIPCGILARRQA